MEKKSLDPGQTVEVQSWLSSSRACKHTFYNPNHFLSLPWSNLANKTIKCVTSYSKSHLTAMSVGLSVLLECREASFSEYLLKWSPLNYATKTVTVAWSIIIPN